MLLHVIPGNGHGSQLSGLQTSGNTKLTKAYLEYAEFHIPHSDQGRSSLSTANTETVVCPTRHQGMMKGTIRITLEDVFVAAECAADSSETGGRIVAFQS